MPYGYNGKILRVNLSEGKTWVEEPGEAIYRRYLGGIALACYYMLRELPKGADPLSPDNMLIIAPSVITGIPAPGTSRFAAAAKSPLTGGFGGSEAGGWWAPELKKTGFDAVIIQGRAPKHSYLWIHDGKAEIRDASKIWGMVSGDAQEAIRDELGDKRIRVLQIGPAGERLVRFANITNELRHFNGRTGLGAVMGSKNLRAIAVLGSKEMEPYDGRSVSEVLQGIRESYKPQPGDLHDLGTSGGLPALNESGILPTRNFLEGEFENANAISGQTMKETILIRRGTCFACPVACKREVKVDEGPYQVEEIYGGPEYETMAALGSLCGVGDLKAIAKANELCAKYVMDTISTGVCIAFAMECYENGILTKEDTGGIELRFGNADAMVRMVEMIAKREGFGDILAEGVARASQMIGRGSERYAMHVKGQELPMHEPRGKRGLALAYSTSPTGAEHMHAPHDPDYEGFDPRGHPLGGALGLLEPVSPLDMTHRKVRAFYYSQMVWNMYNSLCICVFVAAPIGPFALDQIVKYVRSVTGWDTSLWELLKVGERTIVMPRMFNFREGFSRENDVLPERLFQSLKSGALKGERIEEAKFQEMLELYYEMCGWNKDTGFPTRGKLAELDLLDLVSTTHE
jgi:aldehyde:ferredoxin oxidoreductase